MDGNQEKQEKALKMLNRAITILKKYPHIPRAQKMLKPLEEFLKEEMKEKD